MWAERAPSGRGPGPVSTLQPKIWTWTLRTVAAYITAGADHPGFGQGGPASEAESCRRSSAESSEWSEPLAAKVLKQALEAFGFLMLKYAFS